MIFPGDAVVVVELLRGLAVQVDLESRENKDSEVMNIRRECEIDIAAVGKAEKRGE